MLWNLNHFISWGNKKPRKKTACTDETVREWRLLPLKV